MAAITICSDFGAPKIKSATVSIVSPSIYHKVMGQDAMILVFWMLGFKPTFLTLLFHFHQEALSSSSLSALRVVSSAYLRLLIFLPAILIPACASSSPALKKWCFRIVALEKTLEGPLDCKEIQPVTHKGNEARMFIRRTDAEAEAPVLWPPDAKNQLIGKDPDAGEDCRQKKRAEKLRWLDGITDLMDLSLSKLRDSEGQESLVCCCPWGRKESDST